MTSAEFVQILMNGLVLASIYVLVASGFALVYSIMRIVNFAHGEIYMMGAFALFYLFSQWGINYFFALILSMLLLAVLGFMIERVLFFRLQTAHLSQVIASLGLAIVLQGIASVVFGPEDKSIDTVFAGVVRLAGASISVERLVIVPISAALIACLFAYIQWTRSGRAMRAVAQDADAAALQGVNPVMISGLAFAIGCALAAGAGGLVAPVFLLNPFMGGTAVMKAFVIICLGGMGSVLGAVLGGLILGLVDSFCTTVFGGPVAQIAAFVILIAVLLFRPQGLLGRESR